MTVPPRAPRIARLTVSLVAAGFAAPAAAPAASVSYVDGGEVWQATLDGSRKVKLSSGEGTFRDVAQADGGHSVGVRRGDAQRAEFSRFNVWNPDGTLAHDGPLLYEVGPWTTRAFPLGLDVTPDGGTIVFGFSNSYDDAGRFPVPSVFGRGTIVMSARNVTSFIQTIASPLKQLDREWPTLAGSRLVSRANASVVLQRAVAGAPYTEEAGLWLSGRTSPVPAGFALERTDVAANGTSAAVEYERRTPDGTAIADRRIDVFPIAGVGGAPNYVAGCRIPAQGWPSGVSLSPDGRRIAWRDDGGVKVAGIPDFSGVDDCRFTAPPVVISPTGSSPSIGGATPPVRPAGGGLGGAPGSPAGSGAPATPPRPARPLTVRMPARMTAAALRRGVAIGVGVAAAGPVRITVAVPSTRLRGVRLVVVARGRKVAAGPGRVTVRVTATKAHRAKLRRLRGVVATVQVTAAGARLARRVKLR